MWGRSNTKANELEDLSLENLQVATGPEQNRLGPAWPAPLTREGLDRKKKLNLKRFLKQARSKAFLLFNFSIKK